APPRGAQQARGDAGRAREPGAELERAPRLAAASERDEHGRAGLEQQLGTRRDGHVARRRRGRDESRHDEQLGLLLTREPRQILTRVGRREAGGPDSALAGSQTFELRRPPGQVVGGAGEVDEQELTRVARERERRDELEEAGVRADDRSARPRPERAGLFERRVVAEDRALELLELRARLDPELVHEQPATLAVARERVGLAPAAVEREHQLPPQPLAQRLVLDEPFELGDEAIVATELELGGDPLLVGRSPE